jgi:hypothetical protein
MSEQQYWILGGPDGHTPIPIDDALVWGEWFQTHNDDRVVQRDADEATGWLVSTVFLGLDHNFLGTGPPILFETMVFAPSEERLTRMKRVGIPVMTFPPPPPALVEKWDTWQQRYATWDAALAGHREVIAALKADLAAAAAAGGSRV